MSRISLYFLLMIFSLSGLAQKKKPDEKKMLDFENAFMNAQKEQMTGNEEKAFDLFKKCTNIDPKQATPYYKLAQLSMKKRAWKDALEYNMQALKLDEENKWIVLQQAQIYEATREYELAAAGYERIAELTPEDYSNFEQAANLYSMAGKFEEAIRVYDKAEKQHGIKETNSLQKVKLYQLLKKQTKAEAEIQKLIAAYPAEMKYRGILAEFYLYTNEKEKAVQVYLGVLEMDPSAGWAHLALSKYWSEKGDHQKAFDALKRAFSDERVEAKEKINALRPYHDKSENETNKQEAMELAEILCKKHPNEAVAHIAYAMLLYRYKQYSEARNRWQQALLLEPNNPVAWHQTISCSLELKEYGRAAGDCEKAIETFPEVYDFYLLGCLSYIEQNQYKLAIEKAKAGLESGGADKETQMRLLASWADAANHLKNYKQSDSLFEKALELDAENTFALNNYAYFLSLRKDKLERAAEMSKVTITKEPDNPTYLDTYGWILYQQGKYTEALPYLEKAVGLIKESAEVNEHYGDLQYRLGNIKQALVYWNKALEQDSSRRLWLEKKIREQKISD